MEKSFDLEITTPQRVVLKATVTHVKAPGIAGYFGVLANHAPFLTALKVGVIEAKTSQGMRYFATSGGFAEVNDNRFSILVESAEAVEEIDVARARQAKDRALKRIEEKKPETDMARARAALARALNRLQLAELVK
jgi:F-type H+-transporting ATPase subunit epsilon